MRSAAIKRCRLWRMSISSAGLGRRVSRCSMPTRPLPPSATGAKVIWRARCAIRHAWHCTVPGFRSPPSSGFMDNAKPRGSCPVPCCRSPYTPQRFAAATGHHGQRAIAGPRQNAAGARHRYRSRRRLPTAPCMTSLVARLSDDPRWQTFIAVSPDHALAKPDAATGYCAHRTGHGDDSANAWSGFFQRFHLAPLW